MLLSQDIHQPLDNSDALWSQLCFASNTPYKLNRTQRGKETKDTDAKYVCNRLSAEEYLERDEQLSDRPHGRSAPEGKKLQRRVLRVPKGSERFGEEAIPAALHLLALRQRVHVDVQSSTTSAPMRQQGGEEHVPVLLQEVLQTRPTQRAHTGASF
ncbi:uncharacterized protein LOC143149463 [Ptiloglossa arizonensis]|uniref:uncharacterized protein LOC143149463 n=1 Tax=Ptiloglossa arizonensis TaxID=3350558 RepID=UPI003FA03AA8